MGGELFSFTYACVSVNELGGYARAIVFNKHSSAGKAKKDYDTMRLWKRVPLRL